MSAETAVGVAVGEHALALLPMGALLTRSSGRPLRLGELWTLQSNEVARRLDERHGFVAVEETDGDDVERAPDGSRSDRRLTALGSDDARPSGGLRRIAG